MSAWFIALITVVAVYTAVRVIKANTDIGGREPVSGRVCDVSFFLDEKNIGCLTTEVRGRKTRMTYRRLAGRYGLGSLDCDRVVAEMILTLKKERFPAGDIPGIERVIEEQIRDPQTREETRKEMEKITLGNMSAGRAQKGGRSGSRTGGPADTRPEEDETYDIGLMEDLFK